MSSVMSRGVIAERAAGGVRGDERRFADFERVVERFVGDVRNVDHDSLPVHFADDFFAEIGEAVVRGLVGGGIGPLGVVEVRERHVADAEVGEDVHDVDVVADHVAAFDAHERGDFVLGVGAAYVFGGAGEDDVVRIFARRWCGRASI